MLLHFLQHVSQSLQCQHLVRKRSQDKVIHLLHADRWCAANASATAETGIALVTLVAATFARCSRHARAAALAMQQASEKGRGSHEHRPERVYWPS